MVLDGDDAGKYLVVDAGLAEYHACQRNDVLDLDAAVAWVDARNVEHEQIGPAGGEAGRRTGARIAIDFNPPCVEFDACRLLGRPQGNWAGPPP